MSLRMANELTMAPEPITPCLDGKDRRSLDRIEVLDVLRGIALLGMFLVHFNDHATASDASSGLTAAYQGAVRLFFEERFWAMFAILFGVGFGVQLRRAAARGGAFGRMYARRLAALAGFGLFAHAVFGFNVLLGYALWGLPLLLVRRWSIGALVLALLVSASSWSLFVIAHASYRVAAVGEAAYRSERAETQAANRRFNETNRGQQEAGDYKSVFAARLRHMAWFYAQPFSFLPVNTFTLFLIGVIGLRLGVFDRPAEHERLIVGLVAFGVASWAVDVWLLTPNWTQPNTGSVRELAAAYVKGGIGLIRSMWLTFAYIGVVLLLASRRPAWIRRLTAFRSTGRMALTVYMIQIAILDLTFSNYALHISPTPLQALAGGLILFASNAALCRWWLARFRFGPLEWLWRSITYGRWHAWRIESQPVAAV
jgi:uncharacterized protein